MSEPLSPLFGLDTSEERRYWLACNQPARAEELILALWAEASRREHADPHTLLHLAQTARDMAVVWADQELDAIALRIEASGQRTFGYYEASLVLYQQAIDLYKTLGQEDEAARAVVGPLDSLLYLGHYQEALELAVWASAKMRAIGDQAVLGRLLVNQGNLYARLAQYREAQQCYAEARQIFAALGNAQHMAMVAANEANILTNLNDFRQAEELYLQARPPLLAAKLTGAVAQIDHNRAYLHFAQGDYQRALQLFQQARTAFLAQQSEIDVAYVDLYRSDIYLALNLWSEALALAQTTYPIFAGAQMQWEAAQLLLCQVAVYLQIDQATTGAALLLQARQIFIEQQNTFWVAVTDLYQATLALRSGKYGMARDLAIRAQPIFIEAKTDHRTAQCEIIMGEVALAENHLAAALTHFQKGLLIAGTNALPVINHACHVGLARLYRRQGQIEPATEYYRRAVADIERLQATIGAEDYKIAFRRDKLQVYEELLLLYLEHKTPAATQAAFATMEGAKARTFIEAIARPGDIGASDNETKLRIEYQALKQELNWYYNQLYAANNPQVERLPAYQQELLGAIYEREIALEGLRQRWRHPDLAATLHNPVLTITASQLQAILPADTILLEFYLAERHLIIFGVTAERMWTVKVAQPRTDLAHLLDDLRFQMNKFSYDQAYHDRYMDALLQSVNEVLHEFYQILIQPIAHELTAHHLIIVPHDLLHYLPFHAFYDGRHYLSELHALSYAPSATILHHLLTQQTHKSTEPPLILGEADAAIPYAEAEVVALQHLFPTAELRLGPQATTSLLLAEQRRPHFLHIATHALFRADTPFFSALKLADGWLTVDDLYRLTTVAPLVTLSACETARNEINVGDELVGLCRGFFSAGVQALVVSLWMAEDRATAKFMQHFYQALQDGRPVYHALHTAQLALLHEYRHPYYWALFVLTGNPLLRLSMLPIIESAENC